MGSGLRALHPESTQLCDIRELIFAIAFLILLPANQENQEAGPENRSAEKRSARIGGEDVEKEEMHERPRRRRRPPPRGSAAHDLDGVSVGLVTDQSTEGGGW